MKKSNFILLLLFVSFFNKTNAQLLPDIEVRSLTPDFDKTLQADYFIKTTRNYKLNGAVKEVKETVSSGSSGSPLVLLKTTRYDFLENNRLSLYMEDTSKSLINSNATIEKYFFDEIGKQLIKVEIYSGIQQNSSKTLHYFDDSGFITQTVFERYISDSYYSNKEEIFDYTLNYLWNKERDTVQLKYIYKTPPSGYQRNSDRLYSFVFDKQMHVRTNIFETMFYSNQITYDEKGNVIKWLIIDNTIKDSYNIDLLYEYQYNENSDLIEVSLSTTGMNGRDSYHLEYKYEISYLAFDKNGNWLLKKVKSQHESGVVDSEYIYRREISYY